MRSNNFQRVLAVAIISLVGIAWGIAFLSSNNVYVNPNQILSKRNPDGLYQLGEEVATTVQANIDIGNRLITFQEIRNAGKLDAKKEIEYRDFVLQCAELPPSPGTFSSVSNGARCTILHRRRLRR
jgi:hypothetical protein